MLKVRTRELYEGLLRNHLYPAFGGLGLVAIDDTAVRRGCIDQAGGDP